MADTLRIFDTLSGKVKRFAPLRKGKVSMFVCGPTVQSLIHMGHARSYVFYDVVARYLAHLGYRVDFLMNITDQDERITQAASESKEDPEKVALRFTDTFLADMKSLGCDSVTRFEPTSAHVGEAIRQVRVLLDAGMAYVAGNWVYFDTSKAKRFGRLSHLSKAELSLRPLELSPRKRHLNDFAVWRPEVLVKGKWKSPWGLGTPGWHIQDTAVSIPNLGAQHDIHGGAYELVYPHHEAQIAQAEALTGRSPFVRYWVHTHHMNMEGRKMSKSTGNVLTVRDALLRHSRSDLRLFLLSSHYRNDMDLSGMERAADRLRTMRGMASEASFDLTRIGTPGSEALRGFEAAMNDDFDTPGAIDWVEMTLRRGVRQKGREKRREAVSAALAGARVLGVDLVESPSKK